MSGSSGRVVVSKETINRDEVIRDYSAGRITRNEASLALGKSERQISRMIKEWRRCGILGLEHKLLGRSPKNQIEQELKAQILKLLTGKYSGFNAKHFHEQLLETEKILGISYSSVKRIARGAGLGQTKRRRGKIRRRRQRFSQAGYMLQMDGSTHYWWKGQERCLIAGIDDATSDVPYGEFFKTETLEGYMRVLRKIIEKKGIPRVVYVDRASWLGGNSDEEKSQFQRMCEELGTRVIYAGSAEAKGRVERLWGTLQDRLVSEFRLNSIDEIEKANNYLNEIFIPNTWLKKFTVIPQHAGVLYRPRPKDKDLDQIFCLKFERKIRKDHTLLFGNGLYAITADLRHSIIRKMAEIRIYSDGKMKGYYGGLDLELRTERSKAWNRFSTPKKGIGLTTWLRIARKEIHVQSAS